MISFYPGPSRVYDKVAGYARDAYQSGILSMNHRSPEFEALCKKTVTLLKRKTGVPKSYTIFFTSSATECWEIIAQSFMPPAGVHIFNGAFGEKWFEYTRRLQPEVSAFAFDRESRVPPEALAFVGPGIICLTQNETSNGTQLDQAFFGAIKRKNPGSMLVVDATSSMAGIRLDFAGADLWFASVQKCFGMPAGLAVMAASPRAMAHIRRVNDSRYYNSLTRMADMMTRWQTSYTPNVLGIYLLMRSLEDRPPITVIDALTRKRFRAWQEFFSTSKKLELLVKNRSVRSFTVITVKATPELIKKIKTAARKKGFLLGEGYGDLKPDSFRIANFPAIKEKEISGLMKILAAYL